MVIKKISIFVLCSALILLLAGCGKKTIMDVSFAKYTFAWNTNNKSYTMLASESPAIIYQAQQVTTGAANSLVISQMQVSAETVLEDVVKINTDQLAKKLLAYKGSTPSRKDFSCDDVDFTGYISTFSYTLDSKQTFYVYQYYFMQDNILYLISFQSDNEKDRSATAKSVKGLACK